MGKKNNTTDKDMSMKQLLNATKELNPDDYEVGKMVDIQEVVEQKDDYNPDDDLNKNPKAERFGSKNHK